jgi:hypothetical protein
MATMDTMDRTGRIHIQPGMDVYDLDTHKVGTVAHVHERAAAGAPGTPGTPGTPGAPGVPGTSGAAASEDIIEVKTGFLGLGKHLFIPQSAVRDVTEGGVFLSASRDMVKHSGWESRPTDLEVRPSNQETVPPHDTIARSAADATTWEEALPRYRTLCFERYGSDATWERYEPRYRFVWEMRQAPDLAGQSWASAQMELRRRWEVLYPAVPWEGAADTIQGVW